MERPSEPAAANRRGVLVHVVLLAPALIIALWVPRAFGEGMANWVLPGAALLCASGVWFWIRVSVEGGHWLNESGQPSGSARGLVGAGMVSVFAFLLAAAACFWPASRTLGVPPSPLELTAVMLLVPLAEELYFRGAWLASLRSRLGPIVATLLVSAVFGLLHHDQGQLFPMLIASLVLCALTLWTRTLLWAVTIHAVWNALTLVVRMPPGPGRIIVAGTVTLLAFAAMVWQLSRAKAR